MALLMFMVLLLLFLSLLLLFGPIRRKETNSLQNQGTAASKLLYTLHWTLLDAAEECSDADREAGIVPREPFPYIFPLTCIQVSADLFYIVSDACTLVFFPSSPLVITNPAATLCYSICALVFRLLYAAVLLFVFFLFLSFCVFACVVHTGIRVPVRSAAPPAEGGGFAEFSAREWIEDLARLVGLPPPKRLVFHGSR